MKTRSCPKCGKKMKCYGRVSRYTTAVLYLKCDECNIRRIIFTEETVVSERDLESKKSKNSPPAES